MDPVSTVTSTANILYTGYKFTAENIQRMKFSSRMSQELLARCLDIVEDLQQINPEILNTGRGHRLMKTVETCLEWCHEYDKKWKITRFFLSNGHKMKFFIMHTRVSLDFYDLCFSCMLTKNFPNYQIVDEYDQPKILYSWNTTGKNNKSMVKEHSNF